jgi:hypothetical protein
LTGSFIGLTMASASVAASDGWGEADDARRDRMRTQAVSPDRFSTHAMLLVGATAPVVVRALEGLASWRLGWTSDSPDRAFTPLPGDVVVFSVHPSQRWSAGTTRRLKCLSAGHPCVGFVLLLAGSMEPPPSWWRAVGPGWIRLHDGLLTRGALEAAGFTHGLGAHHLGVDLQPVAGLDALALEELLAAPDAGPTLGEVARRLSVEPAALSHSIQRGTDLTFTCVRERRGVAILLATMALTPCSLVEAARGLRLDARIARAWLGRHAVGWRRSARAASRTILRDALLTVLCRAPRSPVRGLDWEAALDGPLADIGARPSLRGKAGALRSR